MLLAYGILLSYQSLPFVKLFVHWIKIPGKTFITFVEYVHTFMIILYRSTDDLCKFNICLHLIIRVTLSGKLVQNQHFW